MRLECNRCPPRTGWTPNQIRQNLGRRSSSDAYHEASEVLGAPAELKILFANLIENAVRYTPTGGSVDVSVRRYRKTAIVEVADTGCGVEESQLPHLFDRLFRAAPPDVAGSGPGLAIVEAIAKRHGLAVKVENRHDRRGLVARVSFPVGTSDG